MSICTMDCFRCPFPDCINNEEASWQERKNLAEFEREIILSKSEKNKKIAAYKKAYREANKEEIAAYQKAYYEANKEEIAAHQKAYREANKEKRIIK